MWYSLSVDVKLILSRQPTRDYVGGIFLQVDFWKFSYLPPKCLRA